MKLNSKKQLIKNEKAEFLKLQFANLEIIGYVNH